jgi:hypothetical protein
MGEDMTPDEHLAMAEELLRDPPKAGELVNSVYQRQVTALWHLGLAHLAAIRARQAPPDGPRRWALPDEPGPEVTAVRDRDGRRWYYGGRGWIYQNFVFPWVQLLRDLGPLTDATPAADGQDGDGR